MILKIAHFVVFIYCRLQHHKLLYGTLDDCMIHYITVWYITLLYSTLQYITLQYITSQYSIVQYITVQYSSVHHSTVQNNTVHNSTLHNSTVHDSTLQYSILCTIQNENFLFLVHVISRTDKNLYHIWHRIS